MASTALGGFRCSLIWGEPILVDGRLRAMNKRVSVLIALALVTTSLASACTAGSEGDGEQALGGDRLPVKVASEVYPETDTELTGVASLDDDGCWMVDIGDGKRLLVFPEGFVEDESGAAMVSSDGSQRVTSGSQLAFIGGPFVAEAMPEVPDGFWGNYLAFCAPEVGEFVVIDLLLLAGD